MRDTVYQRGWVINSQQHTSGLLAPISISKGMGDQFSAKLIYWLRQHQYIKGDG